MKFITIISLAALAAVATPALGAPARNVHGVVGDPIGDIIGNYFAVVDTAQAADRVAKKARIAMDRAEQRTQPSASRQVRVATAN